MILTPSGMMAVFQFCASKEPWNFFPSFTNFCLSCVHKIICLIPSPGRISVKYCPPCFPLVYCHCQVCPLLPGSRPARLSLMSPLSSCPGVTQWCWVLEAVWGKDSPQLPWPWIYSLFPKTIQQASQNQQLSGIILSPWSHTLQKTQSAQWELTAPTIETENFSELMAASLHTH